MPKVTVLCALANRSGGFWKTRWSETSCRNSSRHQGNEIPESDNERDH